MRQFTFEVPCERIVNVEAEGEIEAREGLVAAREQEQGGASRDCDFDVSDVVEGAPGNVSMLVRDVVEPA